MPRTSLKVALVRHTPDPEQIVALGARLCYASADMEALQSRVARQDQGDYIASLFDVGHLSMFEHASFTFAVEGVSRILLAQLTRHRLASFAVQSQRYVSKHKGFDYIVPPAIEALGDEAVADYARQMETMHAWYVQWQQKLGAAGERSNEDARFVLPGACETRLIMTMNARELLHFFSLRCCMRAQWEIRAMAREMLHLVYQVAPALFEKAGPACVCGDCPEGPRGCGEPLAVREAMEALKHS